MAEHNGFMILRKNGWFQTMVCTKFVPIIQVRHAFYKQKNTKY